MSDLLLTDAPTPRTPGAEPLAGYRLIEPLGRGGFGEVWKCEAPGGLHKAIKFVTVTSDGFQQELGAFQQIKTIRHPFLLTLERVEQVGNDLLMVMELADGQLSDRFKECQANGLPAIPREELLGYVREAAEALDTMGAKYGLQHLDVKPENIFVVSGHAKVGDYGLVRKAHRNEAKAAGGFTPKYTPPEVLTGKVDIRSDQYSLALVYAELLTGKFPYPGRSANQIMLQHMQGTPDLRELPPADRPPVERALSKDPAGRFPSCMAFVRELTNPDRPGSSSVIETVRAYASTASVSGPASTPLPRPVLSGSGAVQAEVATQRGQSALTSMLVRPQDRPVPTQVPAAPPQTDRFADLTPVMPVDRLHQPHPRALDARGIPVLQLLDVVVQTAIEQAATASHQKMAGEQVRFLSTMPVHMMPYKLVLVAEQWGLSARQTDLTQVVLRKEDRDLTPKPGQSPVRGGYEVVIKLPAQTSVEVTASARLFGSPDRGFVKASLADIPAILEQVRSLLQNIQERRLHPRHPFDTPIRVFPLFTDGQVGQGESGRLIDVSLGGIRFFTPSEPGSDRLFIQFPEVDGIERHAVYARVLRKQPAAKGVGVVSVARFRRPQ